MTDSIPHGGPLQATGTDNTSYPSINGGHSLDTNGGVGPNSKTRGNMCARAHTDIEVEASAQDAPLAQSVKETVSQGPVAENVKHQYSATQSEYQGLTSKIQKPDPKVAKDEQLTQYHSFFYSLLSWEQPRITAICFVSLVLTIFAARYLNIIRYVFKTLYLVLGVTASAEVAGKLLFSSGFTSQIRPRKYYTIPKDTLESVLDDVQELINFFVIEFQRVLFAENVVHTIGAFIASVVSYLLIKFVPFWGLTLIGTSVLFLAPLIYVNNKEMIDAQLNNVSEVVSKQATQVKDIAGEHTSRATESVKSYAGEYTSKAQHYIGSARARTGSPLDTSSSTGTTSSSSKLSGSTSTAPSYSANQFPTAPKQAPSAPIVDKQEPLVAI